MKLIYCPFCHDIIRLRSLYRHCSCSASGGVNNTYEGKAIPIEIDSSSFEECLKNRSTNKKDCQFVARIVSKKSINFTKIPIKRKK